MLYYAILLQNEILKKVNIIIEILLKNIEQFMIYLKDH